MESDMDLDLMEMFTSNLLTEDDTRSNIGNNTLAVKSHSRNTSPLVDLSDDTEPHHQIADLSGDLEPGHQEAAQELAAPVRHLHPHHHLHCLLRQAHILPICPKSSITFYKFGRPIDLKRVFCWNVERHGNT